MITLSPEGSMSSCCLLSNIGTTFLSEQSGTGQNRTESKVVTGIGGDDVYVIVLSSVHHVSLSSIWSNKMKIANGCIHRGSGTTFSGSPSTMISLLVGLTGMHIILHIQLAQGDHLWYRVH